MSTNGSYVKTPDDVLSDTTKMHSRYPSRSRNQTEKGASYSLAILLKNFEELDKGFKNISDQLISNLSLENPQEDDLNNLLNKLHDAFTDLRSSYKGLLAFTNPNYERVRDLYNSRKKLYVDLRSQACNILGPTDLNLRHDSVSHVEDNPSSVISTERQLQLELENKQLQITAEAKLKTLDINNKLREIELQRLKDEKEKIEIEATIKYNEVALNMFEKLSQTGSGIKVTHTSPFNIKSSSISQNVPGIKVDSRTPFFCPKNASFSGIAPNVDKIESLRLNPHKYPFIPNIKLETEHIHPQANGSPAVGSHLPNINYPPASIANNPMVGSHLPNKIYPPVSIANIPVVGSHLPITSYPPVSIANIPVVGSRLPNTSYPPENSMQTFAQILEQQNNMTKQLIETQIRTSLPKPEIEKFSGADPLKYFNFMQNFYRLIECRTSDKYEVLFQLINFCTGEAKNLIQNCASYDHKQDASEGLKRAKFLLHNRYGDPCVQVLSYEKQLSEWPNIVNGDREGLNSFAIFLTNAANAMQHQPELIGLNSTKFIFTIAQKLPLSLQEKWKVNVRKIREDHFRLAQFCDFQMFVERLSQQNNDPQTLNLGYQMRKPKNNQYMMATKINENVNSAKNMSGVYHSNENKQGTHPNSQIINCIFCNKGVHKLENCFQFEKIEIEPRLNFLKEKKLCFGCFKSGHFSNECKNRLTCSICKKNHATLLHKDMSPSNKFETRVNHVNTGNNSKLAIIAVKIRIVGTSNHIETHAFIDNGSSGILVSEDLKSALKSNGIKQQVSLKTISGVDSISSYLLTDKLEVTGLDINNNWHNSVTLENVYTCKKLPVNTQDKTTQLEIKKWPYLSEVKINEPKLNILDGVHLMIGISCPQATEPMQVIPCEGTGPYAILTRLGWMVFGVTNDKSVAFSMNFCKIGHPDEYLEMQLKRCYQIDFSERLAMEKSEMSINDKRFLQILDNKTEYENGHFSLPLPLKEETICLPNNELLANGFLMSLKKKLQKNSDLKAKYTDAMEKMQKEGYSETVPANELLRQDGKVWYIPHHAVINPKKPDKVRPVFNCPAVFKGNSLNQQLLSGPDLTNLQIGVFMRFREGNIAITADIEAMFYQVKVSPYYRDLLRFLWWPDGKMDEPPEVRRMTAHLFGAVSSPSVANYALRKSALEQKNEFDKTIVDCVLKNFYVDDFLKSVDDSQEAIKIYEGVSKILKNRGFKLCKWISNSKDVLNCIPNELRSKELSSVNIWEESLPTESVLGILWVPDSDKFKFRIQSYNNTATKRNVLSIISKLYDPIGISAPLILEPKMVIQETCRLKLNWDEPLPYDLETRWLKWVNDFSKFENFYFDRCYKPSWFGSICNVQLHHFSDASDNGYGMVSYIRLIDTDENIHCSFVCGKSRVSPIKPFTIVQKELTACKMSVLQNVMLCNELSFNIDESYFWTDSQTVLKYIYNENTRFKTFVANRLAIIHSGSELSEWHYIPTEINPADFASRGVPVNKLVNSNWLNGPDFLWKPSHQWPNHAFEISLNEDANIKKVKVNSTLISNDGINDFLNYYSNWPRLKKGVMYLCLFIEYLNYKIHKRQWSPYANKSRLDYLNISEYNIIRFVQDNHFMIELKCLKGDHPLTKKNKLANLNPFCDDDNLIKVGGRLNKSLLDKNSKHPILLPKNHHISNLLIKHTHEANGHIGKNHTIAILKEKYWIIGVTPLTKTILKSCIHCRKLKKLPNSQLMADLPADRIIPDAPPFSKVGVDYFGPFEVKRARSLIKRYGAIFTCLTSRAVHIEVAHSLDTDSFINVLRRFIARRGQVQKIQSDNGTNFVGANNELRKAIEEIDQKSVQLFCNSKNVDWCFNPPHASHFGGVWERIIKSIRAILQGLLAQQNLKVCLADDNLHTLMCEIECILNSRPLTSLSDDINDLNALTPNNILLLKFDSNGPPGLFKKEDLYVRRRWRQVQFLAEQFWKRWSKEYLITLQNRQKWLVPKRNVNINDLVLIIEENIPRNQWLLGRVTETSPSQDGLVRKVKVKTKSSILERPIHKTISILEANENI